MYKVVTHAREYTLRELADELNITHSLARKLKRTGVIPPGIGKNSATRYTDTHLREVRGYLSQRDANKTIAQYVEWRELSRA